MAIAHVNSASQDASFDAAGAPVSFAFDAGSAADRGIYSQVVWDPRSNHTIAAPTYNAISLTEFGAQVNAPARLRAHAFYLVAPATGSNTFQVDPSAGSSARNAVIGVACYSGVDQSTPFDGYTSTSGTDTSAPIESSLTVSSAVGDLVVVFHADENRAVSAVSGFTQRVYNINSDVGHVFGDATGAASVVTTVTWNGGTNFISQGWNVNAAVVGGATTIAPAFISGSSQVFEPTVLRGGVDLAPGIITSGAQVFSPTVTFGAVSILPGFVASSAQVFSPTVSEGVEGQAIAPERIESTAQLFAPTLIHGGVDLLPALIASTAAVLSPTIVEGTPAGTLAPGFITSGAAVFAPTVAGGAVTVLPAFIVSTAEVYAPLVGVLLNIAPGITLTWGSTRTQLVLEHSRTQLNMGSTRTTLEV